MFTYLYPSTKPWTGLGEGVLIASYPYKVLHVAVLESCVCDSYWVLVLQLIFPAGAYTESNI